MDIFDKARELGVMIAGSSDLVALKAAEEALENDEHALKLLTDFQKAQKALMNALKPGLHNEGTDLLRQRYESLKEEIDKCDAARNFLNASANFENLMKQINDIITFMVSGSAEGGCSSSGCGGCSGCNGCG